MSTIDFNMNKFIASAFNGCFVAMPFKASFNTVFEEIISPAVLDAGLSPIRSDQIRSSSPNVVAEIADEIRRSRLTVVDITGHNPNVFYELGIAHALGKEIVLLAQEGDQIPFDIHARRVLYYNLSERGKSLARTSLTQILRNSIYPIESFLKQMLCYPQVSVAYVYYGSLVAEHLDLMKHSITPNYFRRLKTRSSEILGVGELMMAYSRLEWGTGGPRVELRPAEAGHSQLMEVTDGSVFTFGGPGTNRVTEQLYSYFATNDLDCPIIQKETIAGTTSWRINSRRTLVNGASSLLSNDNTDFGLITRCPNPWNPGMQIWSAAGIKAYGTEAAVRAMMTPSIISTISQSVDLEDPKLAFWCIVATDYDGESFSISTDSIRVVDASQFPTLGDSHD